MGEPLDSGIDIGINLQEDNRRRNNENSWGFKKNHRKFT
jgi:hypothetical protein